ncbi:MAG: 50S ribosomal protein L6, partial [Mariprofundus sp.]|nr:50S ribosomal protein L6 [Mariprofundus sp.]
MSRIGKQPITVPSGVEVKINAESVTVKGSKGEMTSPLFDGISISQEGAVLQLACTNLGNKKMKGNFGLCRALLANN